jgi:hypothetical protein
MRVILILTFFCSVVCKVHSQSFIYLDKTTQLSLDDSTKSRIYQLVLEKFLERFGGSQTLYYSVFDSSHFHYANISERKNTPVYVDWYDDATFDRFRSKHKFVYTFIPSSIFKLDSARIINNKINFGCGLRGLNGLIFLHNNYDKPSFQVSFIVEYNILDQSFIVKQRIDNNIVD